jgi:hypothetical protein
MALKKIKQILDDKEIEKIKKHMPAKDSPVLSEDEKSDIEKFMETWDEHWLNSQDKSREIEDDGFHPSVLGTHTGKCSRRNVYLLKSVKKGGNFPPRILRVFGNGHAVHDRLQKSLESMGVEFQSEVEIKADIPFPVRGHADGVMTWNGRKILVEIKSCSDEVFMNRMKWKKAKDEHVEQANIYATILDIDTQWYIYENKNNQELVIFEHKTNRAKAQKQFDKWHAEWLIFRDGKLPQRTYKPDSPTCAGCDIKAHCFGDSEIGVELKDYTPKVKAWHKENDEG